MVCQSFISVLNIFVQINTEGGFIVGAIKRVNETRKKDQIKKSCKFDLEHFIYSIRIDNLFNMNYSDIYFFAIFAIDYSYCYGGWKEG